MDEQYNSQNENTEEIEKLSESIAKNFKQYLDSSVSIVNPVRCKMLAEVYKVLADNLRGNGIKMSYEMHQPLNNMAYIHVIAPSIRFKNTEEVIDALHAADTVGVYAKNDGRVEMEVTFHGITVRAGQ